MQIAKSRQAGPIQELLADYCSDDGLIEFEKLNNEEIKEFWDIVFSLGGRTADAGLELMGFIARKYKGRKKLFGDFKSVDWEKIFEDKRRVDDFASNLVCLLGVFSAQELNLKKGSKCIDYVIESSLKRNLILNDPALETHLMEICDPKDIFIQSVKVSPEMIVNGEVCCKIYYNTEHTKLVQHICKGNLSFKKSRRRLDDESSELGDQVNFNIKFIHISDKADYSTLFQLALFNLDHKSSNLFLLSSERFEEQSLSEKLSELVALLTPVNERVYMNILDFGFALSYERWKIRKTFEDSFAKASKKAFLENSEIGSYIPQISGLLKLAISKVSSHLVPLGTLVSSLHFLRFFKLAYVLKKFAFLAQISGFGFLFGFLEYYLNANVIPQYANSFKQYAWLPSILYPLCTGLLAKCACLLFQRVYSASFLTRQNLRTQVFASSGLVLSDPLFRKAFPIRN